MSSVQQIEEAVKQLTDEELSAFRAWFFDFDAEAWDRKLEADARAGRLSWLMEEAKQDLQAGCCTGR